MGATTTEGTGHGSAEGPVRGLGDVSKILKQTANEAKFAVDVNNKIRSQGSDVIAEDVVVTPTGNLTATDVQQALEDHQNEIDAGGIPPLASNVIVIPTGNLAADDVQEALEEHQSDIDTANSNISTNASNISTNATDIADKIDKIAAPASGDFPTVTGTGEIQNSGVGPDDYYTKGQIDALTYDHDDLTSLQGGSAGNRFHLTTAQHTNLTGGSPTFDDVTLNDAPVDGTDATNKSYVDSAVAGASAWLESVISFSTFAAENATAVLGDRHIASADGGGWTTNNVYEYNGATWDETVVVSGNSTYVTGLSSAYIFNGTDWVETGGVSDHNSLGGLQGGTGGGSPERFHITSTAATIAETFNVSGPSNFDKLVWTGTTWDNLNPDLITHKSATDVLTETNGIFFVNTSGGNVQLTIPDSAAANYNSGIMRFYKETTDANTVTVVTSGGQDIGGSASQVISHDTEGFSIVSDFNDTDWKIIQDNRKVASATSQVFDVAKDGTPYTSVEDAISAINTLGDAAADKRYVVRVFSGTFTENPMTVPSFVAIQGINDEVTTIEADNDNSPLFTMSDDSQIYLLKCDGPTNDTAVLSTGNVETKIIHSSIENALVAIQSDGSGTQVTSEACTIKSTCATGFLSTDSGSFGVANSFNEASTNAYYANGGTMLVQNAFVRGSVNGLYANNGGAIDAHTVNIRTTTNVARTGSTGTNAIIGTGVASDSSGTWDVLQENSNGHFHLSACVFLPTKFSMIDAANVQIDFSSNLPSDEGHVYMEELQVGTPEQGRETVMGEGDSYTRGMLVYTETAVGVFTNVSTEAASISGSAFTFPGVATDNAIYVSSDLQDSSDYKQLLGIKAKITVAAAPGAGEIVAEYWSGAAWTEFNHMSSLANSQYTQHANDIFERTGSEQIRFQDISLAAATWTKSNQPDGGTNRYWIRFRIATNITTAPIFEQFKIHSNRTEVNADGFIEHMGKARPSKQIVGVNIGNTIELQGAAPKDENISYGTIIDFKIKKNRLESAKFDGFGQLFNIANGLDTSMPFLLNVRWASVATAAGNVELQLVRGRLSTGTILDGANTEITLSDVATGPFTADEIVETQFEFYENDALPGDEIPFAIVRDAGSGSDTLAQHVYVVSTELIGNFWS